MSREKRPIDRYHVSDHDMHNEGGSKMAHEGYRQGDMSPHVEDYQKPVNCFSQSGFGTTLEYIKRHDEFEHREAEDIKKSAYKGRYS